MGFRVSTKCLSYRNNTQGGIDLQEMARNTSSCGKTNERRFTRMVDVQQVAVEIQMAVLARLHGGIGRLASCSARWPG